MTNLEQVVTYTKTRRVQIRDAERWVQQTRSRYEELCAEGAAEVICRCAADSVIERLERLVELLGGEV